MEVAMMELEKGTSQLPHQEGDWYEFSATDA